MKMASVSGPAGGASEVKNGAGAESERNACHRPADGSRADLRFQQNPNEQAGNDADGADLAQADHGISGLLVRVA